MAKPNMRCYECGQVIVKGKCRCSIPRPKPPQAKHDTKQEEEEARQKKSFFVIKWK